MYKNIELCKVYSDIVISKFDYITNHRCHELIINKLIEEGFNFWIEDKLNTEIIKIGMKEYVKNSVIGYLQKVDYGKYFISFQEISKNILSVKIVNIDNMVQMMNPAIEINFWSMNKSYIYTKNKSENVKRIPVKYREKTIFSINYPWLRRHEHKQLFLEERLGICPSLTEIYDFPVDIVYTWVNGNDSNWLQTKSKYDILTKNRLDNSIIRYRDNQELKYSLRSVASFFKDFRHIYIVSDHQRPNWLDDNNKKIIFINHEDIINTKYLPTYNSNAIECALHHIPNLSENFIYFNDDFMLGKRMSKKDFFYPNGIIKCFMASEGFYLKEDPNEEACANAAHYNAELLMKLYNSTLYTRCAHIPQGYNKTVLNNMEKILMPEYEKTYSNRFRTKNDMIPTAYLFNYFAIKSNCGVPIDIGEQRLVTNRGDKNILTHIDDIISSKYSMFCINDAQVSSDVDCKIQQFFKNFYPIKAPWEKNEEWF